jgi:hypothetical protein
MALHDGWKGLAKVTGAFMTKADTGTWGICMSYSTDEGSPAPKTWWMTANTADRLAENLQECFGIAREKLNAAFLRRIGEHLTGKYCKLVLEETEYQGNKRIEVKWMNKAGNAMEDDDFMGAAELFGAEAPAQQPPPPNRNADPEDAPF